MNISDVKAPNALGGKTARACDSCLRKRARWFCAADDAFLCEVCDASVHSANQLASRHERVRLKTTSFKGSSTTHEVNSSPVPSWHQGFTRKARTPRHAMGTRLKPPPPHHTLPLVPEINGDQDTFFEENEDQLLYRVPVFDPFVNEFCSEIGNIEEEADYDDQGDLNLEELLTCDAELTDFAADVESLLRKNDSDEKMVKVEDEDVVIESDHFDMELNWDFDYASNFDDHVSCGGDDMKKVCSINQSPENIFESSKSDESQLLSQVKNRMFLLRLNYEEVIADWASQGCGCPWTNGVRPQFNLDDFQIAWLDGSYINPCGGGLSNGNIDSEREARVSRYREKRRTRLFSKKIRYQVRKLNAEKRPRMKGRFVKRTDNLLRLLPSLANL